MKLAIMQPYFFPYIGYFQLINCVDKFIIYDNIQYTKKGWINRNRILSNNKDVLISIPLKKDSDFLNIVDRNISELWNKEKISILNIIYNSYKKSPYFYNCINIIESCIDNKETNLFNFIYNSIVTINAYLNIETNIDISSNLNIDHTLKSQNKVLSICKELNADIYVNSIGGIELYNKEVFKNNSIELLFIKPDLITYKQYENNFIPWLSIIDVMMFNSKDKIKEYLNSYTLI